MREILFRAKDTQGKWHYGDFISLQRENYCGISEHTLVDNKHLCKVDTLGQYTGLEDDNNVKIFEGDILEIDTGDEVYTTAVYTYGNTLCVDVRGMEYDTTAMDFANDIWGDTWSKVCVIGNIYDDPELLEGGKNNAETD